MLNFTLLNNLGDICFSMQGGLGGLFCVNMGIWSPLQQMQTLQVLRTLASLEVGKIPQYGNLPLLVGLTHPQTPLWAEL